jgi:hypothetical protein
MKPSQVAVAYRPLHTHPEILHCAVQTRLLFNRMHLPMCPELGLTMLGALLLPVLESGEEKEGA